MDKIIQEKFIANSLIPASIEITKKIVNQMEKCVCKIFNNGKKGTGFFTKYTYKNKINTVLITNNHILNENEIKDGEEIIYTINNNDNDFRKISINKERKRYTNKILDVTIIEIEEKDNIKEYIEIDDNIMNNIEKNNINKEEIIKYYKNRYNGESIYILNYLNAKEIKVSYGLLLDINEDYEINHKCSTGNGSSGAPILSLENNKLIGLHCGAPKSNMNYNKGTLILYPIIEYNKIKKNNSNNNMINPNKLNEIKIIYDIKNKDKINLFGENFIKNNKGKCKIIIDNKEQDIIEELNINDNLKKKDKLEIKIKEIKTITDISYMFKDCESLLSLPDIYKWNTQNVTNMSRIFNNCKISALPDISNWNTEKVKNMSSIFGFCQSLLSLPDISNWNTQNVENMSNMFCCCNSLSSLPNISNWNTQNVTNMNKIFCGCKLLSSLPDISKWNTKNVKDMSKMFESCELLSSLPNIDNWNTEHVTDMDEMFCNCKSLSSLPNISKWNTKSIKNINNLKKIFVGCDKLEKSIIPSKFKK